MRLLLSPVGQNANSTGTGTNIGTLIHGGGTYAAFDSNTNKSFTACAQIGVSSTDYSNWIGKDWSIDPSGVSTPSGLSRTTMTPKLSSVVLVAPNDMPFLGSSVPTSYKIEGSSDSITWTVASSGVTNGMAGQTIEVDVISGPYQFHRVSFLGDGVNPISVAQAGMYVSAIPTSSNVATFVSTAASNELTPISPVLYGLDFVNDVYTSPTGAALSLADVIDLTARRSSDGLSHIASTPVELIGEWQDWMFTNDDWTIVFEAVAGSGFGQNSCLLQFLEMGGGGFFNYLVNYVRGSTGFGGTVGHGGYDEDNGQGDTRTVDLTFNGALETVFKVVVSRTNDNIAISINGADVVTDNTAMTMASWFNPPDTIWLGNGFDGFGLVAGSYTRSIMFVSPRVSDAEMMELSA